jgi:methionyl-tRNA formyltransferase
LAITPSLRLGFAGTPEFAVPALRQLAADPRFSVCAVFTQPDRPAGRGQGLQSSPVKLAAAQLAIEVLQPSTFKAGEALGQLQALALDVLVVAAYGLILPQAALDMPRLGCINIHASLLPRWRGAAPIQRALLAGDTTTGITIMRMEAGLDTGAMLARAETPIGPQDTGQTLHDRLAALGAPLIVQSLVDLNAGLIREIPQSDQGVTYAAKLIKGEARIDWQRDAVDIDRQVRAFNPWPVAETRFAGAQLRIWEAEPLLNDEVRTNADPGTVRGAGPEGIDVSCGRGVLRVKRLQLAGRKSLPSGDFLKAQRMAGVQLA